MQEEKDSCSLCCSPMLISNSWLKLSSCLSLPASYKYSHVTVLELKMYVCIILGKILHLFNLCV